MNPYQSCARYGKGLLSVFDGDALIESLAGNDIIRQLTNKCDEELRALSKRMGFLLSAPEIAKMTAGSPLTRSAGAESRLRRAACDVFP